MEDDTTTDREPWTLGDRLRKAREVAGYRNRTREFAELVDISGNTLRRYEDDETVPKRHVLIAWADITHFPLEWLETGQVSAHPLPINNDRYATLRTVRPGRQRSLACV